MSRTTKLESNSSVIMLPMSYTPEDTKIAVIGGGNIGTQLACVCASKGYEVRLLSSRPSLFSGDLEIVDENDTVRDMQQLARDRWKRRAPRTARPDPAPADEA